MRDTDLDAAVAAGVIASAQAASLREFAAKRERERAALEGHEERFRFMRGFNDVFVAIGVVMFLAGLSYFIGALGIRTLAVAAVVWALAELLVGRMRLVLPGILLAAAFVGFVFLGIPADIWLGVEFLRGRSGGSVRSMLDALGSTPGLALVVGIKATIAAAAAWAFYWRFKLPFALLPLAASLVLVALAVASKVVPAVMIADPLVLLACALAVFAAAMSFDLSDRERLTRRADCAFWLHLLAAPLIVHSLIWLITPWLAPELAQTPAPRGATMTPALSLGIVLIFAVLAVVAILIDRRALLVSGLSYLGAAIGYTIAGGAGTWTGVSLAVPGTLLLLGALVLALGVGWMPLRQRLLSLFSSRLADRLPPVPARP